jgi:peptide/nickel transport system permease protein
MATYIIRRALMAIVILFLVSIIIFFSMRFLPGDPILMLVSMEQAAKMTEEQKYLLREEFGLNDPIIVQYVDWLGNALKGDLGESIGYRTPVSTVIAKRIPVTFHLGVVSFLVAHIIGITVGIICAVRRGTWLDTLLTVLANIGITIPVFWLGVMMIWLFAMKLGILPPMGYTSPFEDFWLSTKQMIMPVICISILPLASAARQTRSSMLEIMQQDYIRTAWAKGLRERSVVLGHALRNGLIPVITLAGLGVSAVIGGEVLVETVFNIAGMGRLAVTSVGTLDYPVAQAVVMIIAFAVVIANLIVDLSYGWLDPRIRYR